jgi:hypothetical protein
MYMSQQERKELAQVIQDQLAPLVKRLEALERATQPQESKRPVLLEKCRLAGACCHPGCVCDVDPSDPASWPAALSDTRPDRNSEAG